MRRGILVLIAVAGALLIVQVHGQIARGRTLREQERGARQVMEQILRAEETRRRASAADRAACPYAYLGTLVQEGQVQGLSAVPSSRGRDRWQASGYVFQVQLLNALGRPFAMPPSDRSAEPTLGQRFDAWAWPADPEQDSLVLYFASSAGYLLQGDNGSIAGADAPTPTLDPLKELEREGESNRWLVLTNIR